MRGDGLRGFHRLMVANQLQYTIFGKGQRGICPESGTGLGCVKIVRDGVVGGIEQQFISLCIQQSGNPGGQRVGLTISLSTVGKNQLRSPHQLEHAIGMEKGIGICVVNGERFLLTEDE